jgi:hypothetical protein
MHYLLILFLLLFCSCKSDSNKKYTNSMVFGEINDCKSISAPKKKSYIEGFDSIKYIREANLGFSNYSVKLYDFLGFVPFYDRPDNERFDDPNMKLVRRKKSKNIEYLEILTTGNLATLYETEEFGCDINKMIFQIFPKNKNDEFRVSQCYTFWISSLNNQKVFQHQTDYFELKRCNLIFKTLPSFGSLGADEDDNNEITYNEVESNFLSKLKKKYLYKDTIINYYDEINGNYPRKVLIKKKKLFLYDLDQIKLKIECFRKNRIYSTKYIKIRIFYWDC